MPYNYVNKEAARQAGMKSRRGPALRSKILNDLFDKDKAAAVFRELENQALAGHLDAIELYLAYCFGKPQAKVDITSDGEPILTDGLARLTSQQLMELKVIKETIEQN